MAIAVTNIGTASSDTTAANPALTGVTVPSGALIFIANTGHSPTAGGPSGSVADTVNTYTAGTPVAIAGTIAQFWGNYFYVANAGALSGGTITYSKGLSTDVADISAFYATGVATSSPFDASVFATANDGGSGTTANPAFTLTSGTPAVSGELMVAFVASATTTAVNWFSQDSGNGWAAPPTSIYLHSTLGDSFENDGGNQVNAGVGTKSFAPGNSSLTTVYYAAFILGFKAAVAAASPLTRALLGVGK